MRTMSQDSSSEFEVTAPAASWEPGAPGSVTVPSVDADNGLRVLQVFWEVSAQSIFCSLFYFFLILLFSVVKAFSSLCGAEAEAPIRGRVYSCVIPSCVAFTDVFFPVVWRLFALLSLWCNFTVANSRIESAKEGSVDMFDSTNPSGQTAFSHREDRVRDFIEEC